MTALPSSYASIKNPQPHFFSGSSLKPLDKCGIMSISTSNLSGKLKITTHRRSLTVRAGVDGGRPSNANFFVGGFVLGGIVVGALACVFAPQISRAVAETDRKDLMRKLPKFIYDEEKALEKTRKVLTEKIAQLNSAIDELSAQLHANDAPNDATANSDKIQTSL